MNDLLKTILPSMFTLLGTVITIYSTWKLNEIINGKERDEKIKSAYNEVFEKVSNINEILSDSTVGLNKWKKSLREIKSYISVKSIYITNDDENLLKDYLKNSENLKELLTNSNYQSTSEINSLEEQVSTEFNLIRERFRQIVNGSIKPTLSITKRSILPLVFGISFLIIGISLFLVFRDTQMVTIESPKNLETLKVDVDKGAAVIPVSGRTTDVFGSKSRVYVYSFVERPYKSDGYWYQVVDVKSDGSWETIVFPGSESRPLTNDGKTLIIQAFVATDEQINEEIKQHPDQNFISDPNKFQIRSGVVRITVFPK